METVSFSVLELFKMGGVFMWPLLFFSIAVVALAVERAVHLLYHNLRMDDLLQQVSQYVANGDYSGADNYLSAKTKRRIGARVFLAIFRMSIPGRNFSKQDAESAAETEATDCINSLENGFNFLTALGSLSPLTGFLGTVSGMIGAFKSIAEATEVNAQIVANGIYEALITTVFGLIIAIIAMIAHSLLSHVVDKFAASVEKSCSHLIAQMARQAKNTVNAEG